MISFMVNIVATELEAENYFDHDAEYFIGSFLASATIGIILTTIVVIVLKKMNYV